MKREAFIRELKAIAKERGFPFRLVVREGKGSHYRVYIGQKTTIIKSGEITPIMAKVMKKQLGL